MGAQAVSAAPVALSATVVGTSLAAVVGGAATAWSIFTAVKLKIAVPVACAVVAVVALLVQNETLNRLRNENAGLLAVQQAVRDAEPPVVSQSDADEAERLKRERLELLKLRGEVGRLRREMAEMNSTRVNVSPTNETVEAESPKDSPQQINVRARFFTGTDEALEFFQDSSTGIVEPVEMSKLLKHLEESDKVELLASQQVTTLSGRQAQVVSSGFKTNTATGIVTESSHVVDVLPTFLGGWGVALNLAVIKMADKPVLAEGHSDSSLPAPNISQMTANAGVLDGQTVAMARRIDGKKLVVFVTTTLIDSAGNRVHPDSGQ